MEDKNRRKEKVFNAQYKIGECCGCSPSYESHCSRNDYNTIPTFDMQCIGGQPGQKYSVYYDARTDTRWIMMPWYLSVFHNPCKNCKLLCYDADVIDGATGSSEIILPKSALHDNLLDISMIKQGSYNYYTHGIRHFFADILPVALYFKMVGV